MLRRRQTRRRSTETRKRWGKGSRSLGWSAKTCGLRPSGTSEVESRRGGVNAARERRSGKDGKGPRQSLNESLEFVRLVGTLFVSLGSSPLLAARRQVRRPLPHPRSSPPLFRARSLTGSYYSTHASRTATQLGPGGSSKLSRRRVSSRASASATSRSQTSKLSVSQASARPSSTRSVPFPQFSTLLTPLHPDPAPPLRLRSNC